MSTFFRVYNLQIPWVNPSFKDFAGAVFYHFDLGINRSQLTVTTKRLVAVLDTNIIRTTEVMSNPGSRLKVVGITTETFAE